MRTGHGADGTAELYAVGGLPDDERVTFERHVHSCDSCAAEVAQLRDTVAALTVDGVELPVGLRDRVMSAVDAESSSVGELRRRRVLGWLAAACAMAVALGIAVTVWRSSAPDPQQSVAASVMSASDVTTASGTLARGSVAAMYAPSQRATVVATSNLPAVAPTMMYQVWLTVGGVQKSAGMVPGGRSAESMVVMTGMAQPSMVGLSVEPAAGSAQPTSPLLVRFPVRAGS